MQSARGAPIPFPSYVGCSQAMPWKQHEPRSYGRLLRMSPPSLRRRHASCAGNGCGSAPPTNADSQCLRVLRVAGKRRLRRRQGSAKPRLCRSRIRRCAWCPFRQPRGDGGFSLSGSPAPSRATEPPCSDWCLPSRGAGPSLHNVGLHAR
jgi:hypothetical protein